uniref:Uncharacterized protein n=1 Tax=Anguilla anguilla TaxID=7936 RepID=A0A0E9UB05_ANGAN
MKGRTSDEDPLILTLANTSSWEPAIETRIFSLTVP